MIWRSIDYDWPLAAFFLLLVVPIAWMFFFLNRHRQKKLQDFADPFVLRAVVEKRDASLFWIRTFLYCLAWICAVLALMQPKGNERYVSTSPNGQVAVGKQSTPKKALLRKNTHEVIFLVDTSASMEIADVSGEKTRLAASKEIVDDVIRHLKGENVSLFAFTSVTMQIVPSTLDYIFLRLMLQHMEINEGETEGTDIKQALEFLRRLYFAKSSPKTKTLIILSDGGDTHLFGLTEEQWKQEIGEIISPLADAEEKKLRVFSVGLGSLKGKEVPGILFQGKPVLSALEETLLRKLSISGRGELFVVGKMTPFQVSQALSRKIALDESFVDASVELPPPDMEEGSHVYDYYFQIPLALAILALAGSLLIPETRKKIGKRRPL